MTPESIAEIRKRCEAATPGPWGLRAHDGTPHRWVLEQAGDDMSYLAVIPFSETCPYPCGGDPNFISHARTDIPLLLDALESAMKVIEAARDCDNYHHHVGTCVYMFDYRGCTCGHLDLVASVAYFDEATNGKL